MEYASLLRTTALERKKLLIVDSSSLMRGLYEVALKMYSGPIVQPVFVTNGAEALELLQADEELAAVIADVDDLGPIDSIMEQLRDNPALHGKALVLVGTEQHGELLQSSLTGGAKMFIVKPIAPKALHEVLDTLLGSDTASS